MEGVKGMHALATFLSILVVLWITWTFTSTILNFPTDLVQGYLFWGSFIMIGIVTMIAVPYLIAMRDDSTASITSAFLALGVWAFMIIINLLLFPFFNAMVNIFTDIPGGGSGSFLATTMQNGSFIIQIFSILFILLVLATLYILPLLTAINPSIITDRVKNWSGIA